MARLSAVAALNYLNPSPLRLVHLADDVEESRETLTARARLLDPDSRVLLTLHLERRMTVRQIAALLDLRPGTVTRRIQAIKRRLNDPIVTALCGPMVPLDERDRRMALDHFLNRRRIIDLAREHGLTPPVVRRRLQWVKGWTQGRCDAGRSFRLALARVHDDCDDA